MSEGEVRKRMREAPARMASGLFSSPEFQKEVNRYMLSMHLKWGAYLASLIVGLNYIISGLNIPNLVSGPIAVTFGAIGIGWEVVANFRRKKKTLIEK